MAHPFPGVRKAVISEDCHRRMDRLRAFRHRERNTDGTNLDFDIVAERSREAVVTFMIFHDDIRAFFANENSGDKTAIETPPDGQPPRSNIPS
jgi:hypothetical protein